MNEAIICALITGLCAVIGEIIISARNTKKLYSELDKQSSLSDERIHGEIAVIRTEIAELRKTVERHNSVVERTYAIEKEVAKQGEQIKTLFAR